MEVPPHFIPYGYVVESSPDKNIQMNDREET